MKFCHKCGRRIVFDAVPDLESDRDYPDYYHLGCYPGGIREATKPSSAPDIPGEEDRGSNYDFC